MVKLLLVEDDMMISEIYRRKFEAAGFKVAVSVTGKDVLKKVKEEDFDLILLDIVISEMNGMDVLKELKSGGYDPEMKIIIFTSLSDLENQDRAFALGADGYILKSQFNPSELVSEIQRRLHDFKKQHENKNGNLMEIIKKRSKNGKKKILFIEDEEIFVDLFGQKLESEGYLLKYAKNGAEGVKEAMDGDFDLIIMVGPMSRHVVASAAASGVAVSRLRHFKDAQACAEACDGLLVAGDLVYLKGSRGIGLETVLKRFTSREGKV